MKVELTPFPILKTDRLMLRQLTMVDAQAILQLRSNDEVNQYLDRPKTFSIEDAQSFVRKIDHLTANNVSGYWAISLQDDPELIGTICLWNADVEKETIELGYELSPEYQGKGIMHEAVVSIIRYAFSAMEAKVIVAVTDPGNVASVKLLKRSGFKLDEDRIYVSKEDANEVAVYFLSYN